MYSVRWQEAGPGLNRDMIAGAMQNSEPWASESKRGKGTVPVLATASCPADQSMLEINLNLSLSPCWKISNPNPHVLEIPSKHPLLSLPCTLEHHWQEHATCRVLSHSDKTKPKGSLATIHLKQQVLLSFPSSPDHLGPGLMEAPCSAPQRGGDAKIQRCQLPPCSIYKLFC